MNESEKQFSFTRAASSTSGRAKNQIPISLWLTVLEQRRPRIVVDLGSGFEANRLPELLDCLPRISAAGQHKPLTAVGLGVARSVFTRAAPSTSGRAKNQIPISYESLDQSPGTMQQMNPRPKSGRGQQVFTLLVAVAIGALSTGCSGLSSAPSSKEYTPEPQIEKVRAYLGRGTAEISRSGVWSRIEAGFDLAPGDVVRTGAGSRLQLGFGGSLMAIVLTENSTLGLKEVVVEGKGLDTSRRVLLELKAGRIFGRWSGYRDRKRERIDVKIPQGQMTVTNRAAFELAADGTLEVYLGEALLVFANKGQPPQSIVVAGFQKFVSGTGIDRMSERDQSAPEWGMVLGAKGDKPPADEWPPFPWPPPEASGLVDISDDFRQVAGRATLGEIAARLIDALKYTNYARWSFYSAPTGFVLVTCLEQIEPDGRPKPGSERWAPDLQPLKRFDPGELVKRLFNAKPGYFRVVAFVVTPVSFSTTGERPTKDEVMKWIPTGVDKPPEWIRKLDYSTNHTCTALIYEFEKPLNKEPAKPLMPGRLPAQQHLQMAGLWSRLAQSPKPP